MDVITESQRVDRVLLTEDGAVNITLSFPVSPQPTACRSDHGLLSVILHMQHAEGCGESYPVVNYTVDIAGSRLELSAGDYSGAVISVTISSHEMPALIRGQRYSVVIGACNQFTCRSSNMPLTVGESLITIQCFIRTTFNVGACHLMFTYTTDYREMFNTII